MFYDENGISVNPSSVGDDCRGDALVELDQEKARAVAVAIYQAKEEYNRRGTGDNNE